MTKRCSKCGAWAEDGNKFCEQCGSRLDDMDDPVVADVQPEIVDAEIIRPPKRYESPAADAREVRERLVGSKTDYYLPRFEKMENLNSFTSWNWAAFFFGTGWMMYRKMYAYGAVMYCISWVLALLELTGLSLLLGVGIGVFGNYLYMKDINNRTEKAMNMQPEEREIYIQKNSGTGWVVVIILFVVGMVLNSVIY